MRVRKGYGGTHGGFSEELAQKRIRINCVAPGVDTPMLWNNVKIKRSVERVEGIVGKPEDIAPAVCFLPSPEARFITETRSSSMAAGSTSAPERFPTARCMFAPASRTAYPTIEWQGKTVWPDELEKTRHHECWREDCGVLDKLGITCLGYGPPYCRAHIGPGKYDWSFTAGTFGALCQKDVTLSVDLCHCGVPKWIGNFQNPDQRPPKVRSNRRAGIRRTQGRRCARNRAPNNTSKEKR